MVLAVEETGREALSEIRRVLGVLRAYEDPRALAPQPGVSQLERLIDQRRRRGVDATLRVEGTPGAVTPGVDLAAYRIVEAALPRAARAGGGARTAVTVRWQPSQLEIELDGVAANPWVANGEHDGLTELGLAGIRERIALYGGTLEIEPAGNGTARVRATLPLDVVAA
jgi:signal transduction histidine kinase